MEALRILKPSSRAASSPLPALPSGTGWKANSGCHAARSGRENIPPVHPNIQIDHPTSLLITKKPLSWVDRSLSKESPRSDAPAVGSVDPSVKVVVRVRPANDQEKESQVVRNVSSDSLSVGNRTFTFDSVLGPDSTQEDVFKLVGVPLVKNSLAGFNTSVVSYGQTGSGKTYTMWGPPSAMVDGHSTNSSLGIAPRIFHMLFSEIERNQDNSEGKQINYQCRCSFLEVYNDQINDLLDPTQRNLQIRDDAKNGFHVENLTDDYVTTVEDVTQLIVKGLSNRKLGATAINSKSSRSHIVFTCIIESWYKGSPSNCFSSSRTSRISLVDLAGLDRDELEGLGKQYIDEGRHVKHSLSRLGKLVNILAEVSSSGADQKIPYVDSCLTHLLQETLGGNAKVTFICTISMDYRFKAGILSTLRFGDRAKHIQNKAVINEITEDDVNGLSNQIRQLKEELIRAKSYEGYHIATTGGYFKGHNARESLNLLRVSLNRSLILPHTDIDSEEMDVHEEEVEELCQQLSNLCSSSEDTLEDILENNKSLNVNPSKEGPNTEVDNSIVTLVGGSINHEFNVGFCPAQSRLDEVHSEICEPPKASNGSAVSAEDLVCQDISSSAGNDQLLHSSRKSTLSIVPDQQLPILQEPTLCPSPKINNNLKKSIMSSELSANNASKTFRKSDLIRSSLQSCKISPTESLAASLHRGLQIIDYHQQNSAAKSSFAGFSFEHLTSISCQPVDKVDTGMQTLLEDEGTAPPFQCSACKKVVDVTSISSANGNSDMQIVPFNKTGTTEDNNEFSGSTARREMELEALCLEQAATIKHLNSLVDECTKKKEQSSSSEQNQNTASLTDGVMAIMEHENEDHMLLNHHSKNNTEIMKEKSLLKELQNGLDYANNASFDVSEREALLMEIQSLKSQLKSYKDASTNDSLLEQIRNGGTPSPDKGGDELEKERQKWTESESRWISLTEELRLELESNRRLAEKKEIELSLEKKCTAELDDALHRAVLGHARIVEHYAELQEKYNDLLERHRKVMEGIAEVKKAAAKAGRKGSGSAFAAALAAELSTVRIDREKERAYLKEQNRKLRNQLRDTAEAVHAAGELLVRLRDAEETVAVTEEKYGRAQQEVEKLKKQMEKMKRKHTMEIATMKHYLAESRLPESALEPFYRHESEIEERRGAPQPDDDEAWRNAFRPSYL